MNPPKENKFVYTEETMPILITNETIQCADCKYKRQRVIECDIYKSKPRYVLEKRKPCPDYKKQG